jgi:hypothetical protein
MESNTNIATYNPVLSLCTGSHNNTSLLGSEEQANAAVFYICPYLGKVKFPLQHSLSILNMNLDHIQKFPSTAEDTGTNKRTAKHVLQRTLNKMMLKMELSDFQVAADLLGLPCVIRSDQFAYLDPMASMAYQTLVQFNEDSEDRLEEMIRMLSPLITDSNENEVEPGEETMEISETEESEDMEDISEEINGQDRTFKYDKQDLLQQLGRMQLFTYETDGDPIKDIVPVAALYPNRGEGLQSLNRYEYAALVKVDKRRENPRRIRRTQYEFGRSFAPASQYAQFLQAKQRTVVFTSKPPPPPGTAPDINNTNEYPQWRDKANLYGRFFLTLFRPEICCYNQSDTNDYEYTWDALLQFVSELQQDKSIISKFRLMSMHTRIKGFWTPFRNKEMLATYRKRNRKIWDPIERARIREANKQGRFENEDIVDEYDFRITHQTIKQSTLDSMRKQCTYDNGLRTNYLATAGRSQSLSRLVKENSLNKASLTEIQVTAKEIRDGPTKDEITIVNALMSKQEVKDKNEREPIQDHEDAESFTLNAEQESFRQLFRVYLRTGDKSKVPPVTLLHGRAGTGKTAAIKQILLDAEKMGRKTIRTAFNAINAIAMRGTTTCKLCSVHAKVHANSQEPLTTAGYKRIFAEADGAFILIVDEISNFPPHILARLSNCLCQLFKCKDPFGGIPTILVGDMRQMGPVKAVSLTYALMDVISVKKGKKRNTRSSAVKKMMETQLRNVPVPEEQGVSYAVNKYNASHPYRIGAELLGTARWFELSKNQRYKDPQHSKLVDTIYCEGKVTKVDLISYQQLSPADFSSPDSPWLSASIFCSTNR